MTRAEQNRFKKALEDFVRDATSSQASAQKALEKTGIYTRTGKVSSNYGGGRPSGIGKATGPVPSALPGNSTGKRTVRTKAMTAA